MKDLKMKPCKSVILNFVLLGAIVCLPVDILAFIIIIKDHDILNGILMICVFNGFLILIYVLSRLLYRSKLLITDEEIIKYRKGRIVFRIKKEQIEELGYRPMHKIMFFLSFFYWMFGDPMCGILSIRYKKAEVESVRIYSSLFIIELLSEEEKDRGLKEYCECLTKKEAKLICEKMGIRHMKEID